MLKFCPKHKKGAMCPQEEKCVLDELCLGVSH
jgi:hypothetical protein